MTDQLPLLAGYILAAVGFGLFFLHRGKSAAQAGTLESLKSELEKAKSKETSSQKQCQSLKKETGVQNDRIKSLEKDIEKLKDRFEKQKSQEDQNLTSLKLSLEKSESKRDHDKSQIEALTSQLQEVDAEKREMRLKLEEAEKTLKEKEKQISAEFREQLSSSNKKIRNLEKDLKNRDQKIEKATEKLQTADPAALKKARLRLSQYAHLYRIMRGQKEMAEERNQNWELALKMLSGWILKNKKKLSGEEGIGQMVADALEATKSGPLVDDDNGMASPEDWSENTTEISGKKVNEPDPGLADPQSPEAFAQAHVARKSEINP